MLMIHGFKSSSLILLFSSLLIANEQDSNVHQSAQTVLSSFQGDQTAIHLTPELVNIALHGHSLSPDLQEELRQIGFDFSRQLVVLNRPTGLDLTTPSPSGHFLFHYTINGVHAVDSHDGDGDGIPDYVDQMAKIFDQVYAIMVNNFDFTPPPSDDEKGGSDQYDIYIISFSPSYFGFTYPEEESQVDNAFSSYITMRNNYNDFPHSELNSFRVTAAHEYFHAVQFGYDGWEELWLMEATAVWMEEAIYDDINDCYRYMIKLFDEPHRSLDENSIHMYGSYIFFTYVDEHFGGFATIRNIWENSRSFDSTTGNFSTRIIDDALRGQNSSFREALNNMAVANKILSNKPDAGNFTYEESEGYRDFSFNNKKIVLAIQDSVNFTAGSVDSLSSFSLKRFGSQYFKINTNDPFKIELENLGGPPSDLNLNVIQKTVFGDYQVSSGNTQNIILTDETEWIYAVVVSQDTIKSNWDFKLQFSDAGEQRTLEEQGFLLSNAYPNPFNSMINYQLIVSERQNISISIVDILGRRVQLIRKGIHQEGNYNYQWSGHSDTGKAASSGTYYIVVRGKNHQQWKRITLVK
ncbi:MAG: MXAN_6640 family putative metalloprotease [Candidatus Neomarinimicrobiota bacterium]